jgi:hypothetical protein
VDSHVHVGRHLPMDAWQRRIAQVGVDRAVVFADPETDDLARDEAFVLEFAARHGHVPFYYHGGLAYSTNRPFRRITPPRDLSRYRGVKWHCWWTPAHDLGGGPLALRPAEIEREVESAPFRELMAALAHAKRPMIFEEHFDVTRAVVERYPDVAIIIPHLGLLNGGTGRVLTAFAPYPNVSFDTSLGPLTRAVVERVGAGRLLAASDFPYGDPGDVRRQVERLGLPEDQAAAILGGNVARLCGLAAREAGRPPPRH